MTMRAWMLAFALGVCLALGIPELPPFNMLWAVLASLLLVAVCRNVPLVGAYLLGLAWCLFQLQSQQQILLPEALEQEDIWVQGRIAGLPQERSSSTRFRFQTEALCRQAAASDCQQWQSWSRLLRLNDYEGLSLHP